MTRNSYVLLIAVEMTLPIKDESEKQATELLARDVFKYLYDEEWGYGRARVEGVYPVPEGWKR